MLGNTLLLTSVELSKVDEGVMQHVTIVHNQRENCEHLFVTQTKTQNFLQTLLVRYKILQYPSSVKLGDRECPNPDLMGVFPIWLRL